ncbi:hypothetical protein C2S51_002040 [Perilla frutescens var. frutescens]|nr:hypothetical protein C2S51_002040 [Perilla frutescens var. frutescens]
MMNVEDENVIKQVIEYRLNEDGDRVKITTTTTIGKLADARLRRAAERRSRTKFADPVHDDVSTQLTMVSAEEIFIGRLPAPGTNAEKTKVAGNPLAETGKGGAALLICGSCGDVAHWAERCPNKDRTQRSEGENVPSPADMRRRHKENSIRVMNLSEDTREPDLLELFRPFGQDSHFIRVYVPVDEKTGASRGVGFVSFVNREDGERAIDKLNGSTYDNLILRVEWAAPTPK